MPIQIHVKFDGNIEGLKTALQNFPKTVAPYLRRASQTAAFEIERESKIKAPVDTGRLRASIATSLGVANMGITSIVQTNVNYAAAVHEGTKPHWPPIAQLEGWSKRHGIPAFLVARAISRRGTKAQPFMKEAVDKNIGRISDIFHTEISSAMDAVARIAA